MIDKHFSDQTNFENKPRHFGIEIEYAGLPLQKSAELISAVLKTEATLKHKSKYSFDTDKWGTFILELDAELIQKISQNAATHTKDGLTNTAEQVIDSFLPDIASKVTPSELVSPPLKYAELDVINRAMCTLRDNGAKGTQDSIAYAFGLHINPEAMSIEPEYILNTVRAFTLCHDYIIDTFDMDITRKLSGYASKFSDDYATLILDDTYAPDQSRLIKDYIDHHPTRNMALDMLPLFMFLDEALLTSNVQNTLINKRPTFHYRLPDARINEKNWSIDAGMASWMVVEKLAADKDDLNLLSRTYLDMISALPLSNKAAHFKKTASDILGGYHA